MIWIAIAFIIFGLFFLVVGSIGMLRLPNVFTRAHALSLTDSLGAFFVLAGLALYQGFSVNLLRILIVLALIYNYLCTRKESELAGPSTDAGGRK